MKRILLTLTAIASLTIANVKAEGPTPKPGDAGTELVLKYDLPVSGFFTAFALDQKVIKDPNSVSQFLLDRERTGNIVLIPKGTTITYFEVGDDVNLVRVKDSNVNNYTSGALILNETL
jgi:hypothetical protein